MISLKNIKLLDGTVKDLLIESSDEITLDAEKKLTLMPALVDPEAKQVSKEALDGGITTLIEFSGLKTATELLLYKEKIEKVNLPLRTHFTLEASNTHLSDLAKSKKDIVAIKADIKDSALEQIFQTAAQENLVLSIQVDKEHIKSTEKALSLAKRFSTQILLSSITTREELDLVRHAKKEHLLVYTQISPRALFLKEGDQQALWEAISDGAIDLISAGHDTQILLPLLLTASKGGLLSIEKIVELTRINPERIFRLSHNNDAVLIDLETEKTVGSDALLAYNGISPFAGKKLIGWPVYTIAKGKLFKAGH